MIRIAVTNFILAALFVLLVNAIFA